MRRTGGQRALAVCARPGAATIDGGNREPASSLLAGDRKSVSEVGVGHVGGGGKWLVVVVLAMGNARRGLQPPVAAPPAASLPPTVMSAAN